MLTHECPRQDRIELCNKTRSIGYGAAIEDGPSWNVENGWIIGNGEYGSPVWFCPFCGEELKS